MDNSFKPGGAVNPQDALNVANAFYVTISKKINNIMDKLRQQQIASVTASIKAAFALAGAMLYQSMFEAAMQAGIAVGSYNAGNETSKEEKLVQPEQKNLTKEMKTLDTNIQKETDKSKKDTLTSQKDTKKARYEKLQKRVDNKLVHAQRKVTMYNAASQGLGSIPKGTQDSLQEQARAAKAMLDQITQLFNTTYDKQSQVLKGFLDIDFLAALVGLGNIQLK